MHLACVLSDPKIIWLAYTAGDSLQRTNYPSIGLAKQHLFINLSRFHRAGIFDVLYVPLGAYSTERPALSMNEEDKAIPANRLRVPNVVLGWMSTNVRTILSRRLVPSGIAGD